MEVLAVALAVLLVCLVGYIVWLRWKMRTSKARFAFYTVSALMLCLANYLAAAFLDLPELAAVMIGRVFGFDLGVDQQGMVPNLGAIIVTLTICVSIYRFASRALEGWEAAPRVSEAELAKNHLNNHMLSLAHKQLMLFWEKGQDPMASEYAVSWEQDVPDPPQNVEAALLVRDLFSSFMQEVELLDSGWRDACDLWVGGQYVSSGVNPEPLYLFVFDETPTEEQIIQRIDHAETLFGSMDGSHVYGAFLSNRYEDIDPIEVRKNGVRVLVYSSAYLILRSLRLGQYARALLRQFKGTHAGATDATLATSYVELSVKAPSKNDEPRQLGNVLRKWENETSRRHLAITGEYGQGKSTAMLKYCCDWAEKFLEDENIQVRVPLLIELRGRNPAENDPLAFISSWSARYGLEAEQVFNLVKSGNATIIFEGFDELKNSGRAYDRHQHFNALWRFAYPGTKLIFTGRPNFFLDEREANRTLRADSTSGSAGEAFTNIWELQKLDNNQIREACRSYREGVKEGIQDAVNEIPEFLEIVSRPSMLPVVATIWNEIEMLRSKGNELTGALLMERYLQAIYERKEKELERDRVDFGAPTGARYLLLPRANRELLTICIARRMAGFKSRNTISRDEVSRMVQELYGDLVSASKSEGVDRTIVDGIIQFEEKHSDDTFADKVEIITTEISAAGLLVSDPAGGTSNLRFPHKQFYEYLVCKGFCLTSFFPNRGFSQLISRSARGKNGHDILLSEPNTIAYLADCVGYRVRPIFRKREQVAIFIFSLMAYVMSRLPVIGNIIERGREDADGARRAYSMSLAVLGSAMVGVGLSLSTALLRSEASGFITKGEVGDALFVGVVMGIGLAAMLLALTMSRVIVLITVFLEFMKVHYAKLGIRDVKFQEAMWYMARSIESQRVHFPMRLSQPSDTARVREHLSPAEEFGAKVE